MPLPLYLLSMLASLLISAIAAAGGLWAGLKILGNQRFSPRYAVIAVVFQFSLTLLAVLLVGFGITSKWGLIVFVLYIAGIVLIGRLSSSLRGGRLAGAVILSVIFTGAVNLSLEIVLRRTLFNSFVLSSSSMAPTLQPRDFFFVDRTLAPARGDIVAFHPPSAPTEVYVSRVAGLPGETIELRNGTLSVNGISIQAADDVRNIHYSARPLATPGGNPKCIGGDGSPITLGPDEYYFLSDNTEAARDSRYLEPAKGHQAGAIPRDLIVGVVRVRYWPESRLKIWR